MFFFSISSVSVINKLFVIGFGMVYFFKKEMEWINLRLSSNVSVVVISVVKVLR